LKELYNDDNELYAWGKSIDGLTFLKVKDAGHMVPMDQPKNALFILHNLLKQNNNIINEDVELIKDQ